MIFMPQIAKKFLYIPLKQYISKYVKNGDTLKIIQPRFEPDDEGLIYRNVELCSVFSYDANTEILLGKLSLLHKQVIEAYIDDRNIAESIKTKVKHTTHEVHLAFDILE